jgi:O-antigen/teichoic acid export membrane protein
VLAYVFFALVTRALGAERAAPVSVLWAWWSFTGAGLTFPLQHWITRTVTATAAEGPVRRALGRLSALVVGVSIAAGLVATAMRHLLFDQGGLAFPLLAALVVLGSGLMGLIRGVLSARGQFGAVGAGLVAENGLRCVLALGLWLAGVHDPVAYGWALVLGYLTAFAFPRALRLGTEGDAYANPFTFLGGAGTGQLIAQAVLTGGPVVLAAAGGAPADVTALFAGLALFRAPYTLGVGVLAPATEGVTRLVLAGDHDALRRLRSALAGLVVTGVVTGGLFGFWAGPPLVQLVFGQDVRLSAGTTAVIAIGTVLALGNLALTVVLMARHRTSALTRAWVASLVPGALWFALAGSPLLERTATTFLVTEAAALLWMSAEELRAARPAQ